MDAPVLAGTIAAIAFAASNLPMVWKALRTHDVGSYSIGSIGLINAANVVYTAYVFSLPPGPVWVLHGFYVVASAIMLVLCVRARHPERRRRRSSADDAESALTGRREIGRAHRGHLGAGRSLVEP